MAWKEEEEEEEEVKETEEKKHIRERDDAQQMHTITKRMQENKQQQTGVHQKSWNGKKCVSMRHDIENSMR
jgi:hypothetical protein